MRLFVQYLKQKIFGNVWSILGLSLIFTLLMLWNFIFPLGSMLPDRDYALQLWNLWWVNEAITSGQNPYITGLQYYPIGAHLGRHVLSPGFFPVTFLVWFFSGASVFYPFYTYKVIILLSYTLILFFSYLTLRKLGIAEWVAPIPAIGYTFGNFYMNHMNRLHIISGFFIPLIALLVIVLFKKPVLKNGILTAAVMALGLYFTELTLFAYMAVALLCVSMIFFKEERTLLLAKIRALGMKSIVLSSGIFLLVSGPFIYNWVMVEVVPPSFSEIYRYSSNLAGFFIPTPETVPLYGDLFATLSKRITAAHPEFYQSFIGFPMIILGTVAVIWTVIVTKDNRHNQKKIVWFCLFLSAVFFILSLGVTLKVFSTDTKILLPYALLASIPPFSTGRTPIRFVSIALFFWMVVAATGLQWVVDDLRKNGKTVAAVGVIIFSFLWVSAETYTPTAQQPEYVIPPQLASIADGPVLNLPLRYHNGWALMLQMFHHQPIGTGYVSRNEPQHKSHFETLRNYYAEAVATQSCQKFVAMGFKNIFIWDGVPEDVVAGLYQLADCPLRVVDLR